MSLSRDEAERLDRADPFAGYRERFRLPAQTLYLDGNSLGALPSAVVARMEDLIRRGWGETLIGGWTTEGWMELPMKVGAKIARLIGARAGEVLAADSASANLYKLAAAAMEASPDRPVILTEEKNFPTDGYILDGLARLVRSLGGGVEVRRAARRDLIDAIDRRTALVCLTHVDYRTAEMWDMASVSEAAHRAGALALFDLSHSAGAVPVDLDRAGVDLAVGCGYKFLNGGPGAPAFLYVATRHQKRLRSPLEGWMGHRSPFDFADAYQPAEGIGRFACGTPPVSGLAALDAALDLYDGIDMRELQGKAHRLMDAFIEAVRDLPGISLLTPYREPMRGSHVALAHPEGGAIMSRLIERRVIGDFRPPDIMRFGMAPLYTRFVDIHDAAEALSQAVRESREALSDSHP